MYGVRFFKKYLFFPKKVKKKKQFFAKNAFLAQISALVWKKKQIVFKKITSILFYKYQNRHPVKIPFKSIKKWCTFAILTMITCWDEKYRFEVFIMAKVTWRGRQTNVFFLLFGVEFGIFTFSTWKHTYQRGIWARKIKMVKNHQLGHFLVQTFP